MAIVASVIRRSLLALSVVVAVLALSSCSTFNRTDAVATVGSAKLSRSELSDLLRNKIVTDHLIGKLVDGQADVQSQADQVIGIWVVLTALERAGTVDLTGAAQQAALTTTYTTDFSKAPAKVQRLLTQYEAYRAQRSTVDDAAVHAAISAAHVHVDSRYGYWDSAQATVVPFAGGSGA